MFTAITEEKPATIKVTSYKCDFCDHTCTEQSLARHHYAIHHSMKKTESYGGSRFLYFDNPKDASAFASADCNENCFWKGEGWYTYLENPYAGDDAYTYNIVHISEYIQEKENEAALLLEQAQSAKNFMEAHKS